MEYTFIVVMPKELINWIRRELRVSGIAQRNLYRELSNLYGAAWLESDVNKAKEDHVSAVMKRHRLRQGHQMNVRVLRDDRIHNFNLKNDVGANQAFVQKIAEEQNITDQQYQWEFRISTFDARALSFAFPVLTIWFPLEPQAVSQDASRAKKRWQFWK